MGRWIGHTDHWHWKFKRVVTRDVDPYGAGYTPTNPLDRADLQRIFDGLPGAPRTGSSPVEPGRRIGEVFAPAAHAGLR